MTDILDLIESIAFDLDWPSADVALYLETHATTVPMYRDLLW